jgi:hypothetical protein
MTVWTTPDATFLLVWLWLAKAAENLDSCLKPFDDVKSLFQACWSDFIVIAPLLRQLVRFSRLLELAAALRLKLYDERWAFVPSLATLINFFIVVRIRFGPRIRFSGGINIITLWILRVLRIILRLIRITLTRTINLKLKHSSASNSVSVKASTYLSAIHHASTAFATIRAPAILDLPATMRTSINPVLGIWAGCEEPFVLLTGFFFLCAEVSDYLRRSSPLQLRFDPRSRYSC